MVTAFSCSSRSVKIQYDEYTASRISSDDVLCASPQNSLFTSLRVRVFFKVLEHWLRGTYKVSQAQQLPLNTKSRNNPITMLSRLMAGHV